jgi:hypothetical protein
MECSDRVESEVGQKMKEARSDDGREGECYSIHIFVEKGNSEFEKGEADGAERGESVDVGIGEDLDEELGKEGRRAVVFEVK